MTSIGKYEIQGEVGHGGFGKVYRAFDPTVRHVVAIKVLTAEGGPEILNRFRNEATVAVNLHHKNIITVHDFGEANGVPYIVMEFLEGRDLQHVLNSGERLTLLETVQVMTQVAEGLHYAHSHDIAHRDVKPANIMLLADNFVKIMDFGIARVMRDDVTRQTKTGFLLGTIPYMCPEQFHDPPTSDALSDIWAYGIIYYELLAGRHPFKTPSSSAMMYKIVNEEPPRLQSLAPDCPAALADIVHRLLAKDRARRYQSLEDVIYHSGPILFALQQEQAASFKAEARSLLSAGQLDAALAIVRRALDLNRTDMDALQLREEIQQRMQRRNLQPRIDSQLKKAEDALSRRQFEAAVDELEAARQLDPADSSIRIRLEQVRAAIDQSRQAREFLSLAKVQWQAHDLDGAYRYAAEAVRTDPQNPDANQLLGELKEALDEREKHRRVQEVLDKARGLLIVDAFDEAITLLQDLLAANPGSPDVAQALRIAEEQKIAREKEDRLRAGSEAAREQIRQRRFEEAVVSVDALIAEFGSNQELQQLLSVARDQLQVQRRDEAVRQISGEARALLADGKFDAAITAIEQGLQTWRGEQSLVMLLQSAQTARKNFERQQDIQNSVRQCQELFAAGRLREARDALETALTRLGSEPPLLDLRKDLDKAIHDRQRAEAVHQSVQEAKNLISRGQPQRALSLLQTISTQFPGELEIEVLLRVAAQACEQADERRFVQEQIASAELTQRSGQAAQALQILDTAIERYPNSAELSKARERLQERMRAAERVSFLTRQIDDLVSAGRLQEASAQLDAAQQEFPSESGWTRLRDRIAQERRRAETAAVVREIRECLAAGDVARARQLLSTAMRSTPGNLELQQLDREIQAETDYRASMAAAARHVDSHEWDAAARMLRRAEALRPGYPAVRAMWSTLASAQAAAEAAAQAAEAERNATSEGASEARRLADALEFDKALDMLGKLLQSHPGNPELERTRQDTLTALARHRSEIAERAKEIAEGRRYVQDLVRAGQFDTAAGKVQDLLARFPGNPELEADLRTVEAEQKLRRSVPAEGETDLLREQQAAQPAQEQEEREIAARQELPQSVSAPEPSQTETPQEKPAPKWSGKKIAAIAGGILAAVALILVVTRGPKPGPLKVSPRTLNFAWTTGDPLPAPQDLRAEGAGPEKVTATANQPWMEVVEGTAPGALVVSVKPTTLKSGEYRGSVSVAAPGATAPAEIAINLKVTERAAVVTPVPTPTPTPTAGWKLSVESLSFGYEKGGALPPDQTVVLTTAGSAQRFRAAAQSAGNWLTVSPQVGTIPATLRVSVRPNLNTRSSAGKIQVIAGDHTQIITVFLNVRERSAVTLTPTPTPTPLPTPTPVAVIPTPVPTPAPTPPPPNPCATVSTYGGRTRGRFSWRGTLPPGGRLVIAPNGASNGVLEGGGSAVPNYGPCIPVNVNPVSGFDIQGPSSANQYRLIVINKSGSPQGYIEFVWNVR
jgi:serine/threonine protein kinase